MICKSFNRMDRNKKNTKQNNNMQLEDNYPNLKPYYNDKKNNNNDKDEDEMDTFELQTKGFLNIGNSCYMNSFLQILFHSPGFLFELKKNYKHLFDESCLIKSIIDLSEYPENKKYLKEIKYYISESYSEYNYYRQSDSQDFGKDLINEIIKGIKGDIDDSSYYESESDCEFENINDYFKKGKYREYLRKYKKDQIFIEKMFEIDEIEIKISKKRTNLLFNSSLQIDLFFPQRQKMIYTLNDLFNFKFKNNSKSNESVNKKGIQVQRQICKLPKILIINIGRASYDYQLNDSLLNIPETFDINDYVDHSLIKKDESTNYKLFAINEKIGSYKSCGHYYCHIHLKNEDKWYLFDDSHVCQSTPNFNSKNVVGIFYLKEVNKCI